MSSIYFVVTADQVDSRHRDDLVPAVSEALRGQQGWQRRFQRTVGDEIQGLTKTPTAVVDALTLLLSSRSWRVGVGIGAVSRPLPKDIRAARGPAFYAARAAVDSARSNAAGVRVATLPDQPTQAERATSAFMLLAFVLRHRTRRSAEVADLLHQGLAGTEVAQRLGVTPTAVSQHKARAGFDEEIAARDLAAHFLAEARDLMQAAP